MSPCSHLPAVKLTLLCVALNVKSNIEQGDQDHSRDIVRKSVEIWRTEERGKKPTSDRGKSLGRKQEKRFEW